MLPYQQLLRGFCACTVHSEYLASPLPVPGVPSTAKGSGSRVLTSTEDLWRKILLWTLQVRFGDVGFAVIIL
jgi:hypothetical protein